MNAEFFTAIEDIEREKGIPREYMFDKINQAMLAAFRRDNPEAADNAVVEIDEDKKKIEMYIITNVVEEVENPAIEMTEAQARKYSKKAKAGMQIRVPVDTKEFGRIAAQSAKQVIIQGIREAERGLIYDEFTSREHEILTGEVSRIDPRTGSANIKISSNSEYTDALLSVNEQIRDEVLTEGKRLKVYVIEVRKSSRGPQVLISRTHPGLVKRLFELEVPEIADGTVEIMSVAREAGSRTKMAVWSTAPDVDPIGACVGPRGGRVASIVDELDGEKIDIVRYSEIPEEYIAAALSPADVISVTMDEEGKSCRVIVPDNQLSLAIGKEGQNARLAAKLTGFKIDIKPESEG
jgi:N utilization substance protein A